MTPDPVTRSDRWVFLVNAAFRLDERLAESEAVVTALQELVEGSLEVFTPEIDPIDDFEGYAVRRLLVALREAISRPIADAARSDASLAQDPARER